MHSFCPPLDPPEGGGLNCEEWGPGGRFSVCRIYCEAGKKFSQPVPQFYTCGAEGFWRPNLNALGSVNTDPFTPLVRISKSYFILKMDKDKDANKKLLR